MLRSFAKFGFVLILSGCLAKNFPSNFGANQVVYGRDFYAVQSSFWNIKACVKYPMSAPMADGNLDNTFGSKLDNVSAVLENFRPAIYRVHLINAVCIRNNNCGSYEIGYGYTKTSFDKAVAANNPKIINYVKKRTALYKALADANPGTQFIISPALEHDLSKPSWRNLADAVHSVFPGVQLSNSPDGGVATESYQGAWLERHGSNFQSDADIVSLDGSDATQIDINAFLVRVTKAPKVKVVLLWTAGDNCRPAEWVDPRKRTNCPSAKTFELMSHIIDPIPAPVAFSGNQCKKIFSFKDPDIWKPLAETHVKYDPRQELPVTIFKGFNSTNISVLGSNGTKLGQLGYYGTYLDQGFRWYSGYTGGSKLSGYEFQSRAQTASSSPYVWLQQGATCKGPLVTGRRQGKMRD